MPIPVSATEKTAFARRPKAARRRALSPCSVNLKGIRMKFRSICETLPSSVAKRRGNAFRFFEDQVHGGVQQQGAQHSAQRPEQVARLKTPTGAPPACRLRLLARSSRSFTSAPKDSRADLRTK